MTTIAEGLKQTPVGPVPEDWAVATIGDVASTSSGTTPSRALFDRYFANGSINWAKTLDLHGAEIEDTDERVTPIALEETSLRLYPAGTVLVAMYGGFNQIGRTGLLRKPAAVNQAISAIQVSPTKLCPDYLLAVLNLSVHHWKSVASSSRKDPNITSADVREFPIAIPPMNEQHAIAAALRDIAILTRSLDELIAKRRDLKEAAMQQLLTGRVRLAGHGREWKQASLGELFTFKNGLNKAKQYFGFGTPIVNYMDVYKGPKIKTSQVEGRVSLSVDEIKNFEVRKGDVLFTRTSETPEEVGMASVVLDEPSQTVFSGFVLRARPRNDDLCADFKAYCFRSSHVRSQIVSKATYTTRALTNGRQLSAVTLPVPSRSEQAAIAAVLSDMDDGIAALEFRRQKALALKQAMMQQLLTGRIRLI